MPPSFLTVFLPDVGLKCICSFPSLDFVCFLDDGCPCRQKDVVFWSFPDADTLFQMGLLMPKFFHHLANAKSPTPNRTPVIRSYDNLEKQLSIAPKLSLAAITFFSSNPLLASGHD